MAGISAGTAFVDIVPNLKDFGQRVGQGVSAHAQGISRTAGVAGAVLAGGLVLGAKKAISAASSLEEAMSAAETTFGSSAKAVLGWSKNTSDAFSQVDFLSAAKGFAVFGQAAGLSDQATAKFSKGLLDAAGDMASFHDADPSEVLLNLKSGLTGEAEPLRKYGILINEAAVNTEALASGIVKAKVDLPGLQEAQERASLAAQSYGEALRKHGKGSTEARKALLTYKAAQEKATEASKGQVPQLTEAQKILARRELIMKQLGKAEGDWARTIDSAANQERIQAANTTDLQAKLGQGLLPAYKALLAIGIQVVDFFSRHTGVAKALAIGLGVLGVALLVLSVSLKVALLASTLFNVSIALTAGIVFGVILALVLLGVGLVLLWKKSETFRNIVTAVFEKIKTVVSAVVNFIKQHWQTIFPVIGLIVGVVKKVIQHFDSIKGTVTAVVNWVKDKFNGVVSFFEKLPARISRATAGMWDGIKSAFRAAVNAVIGWWNNLSISINVPDFLPGPGSVTFSTPDIPMLAHGGVLGPGQFGVVGERGPELIRAGRDGLRVTPALAGAGGGVTELHFHSLVPYTADQARRVVEMTSAGAGQQPRRVPSRRSVGL